MTYDTTKPVYPDIDPSELEPWHSQHLLWPINGRLGTGVGASVAVQLAWRDKLIAELEQKLAAVVDDEDQLLGMRQRHNQELRAEIGELKQMLAGIVEAAKRVREAWPKPYPFLADPITELLDAIEAVKL